MSSSAARFAEAGSGILYIEDFDAAQQPCPEIAAPTPEPSFTTGDIDAAHEAGRLAGLAEALEERECLVADLQLAAVQSVADAALNARVQSERLALLRAEELAATIIAALLAALPGTMRAQAAGEFEAIVEALLPAMRCEPEISVRANPDQLTFLEGLLRKPLEMAKTNLVIYPDADLHSGSVFFEWRDGGAARDCDVIWQQIAKVLEPIQIKKLKDHVNGC